METKLFLGDCLKILSEIKTESIHAVVTDPPYQYLDTKIEHTAFDKPYNEEAFIEEIKRVLKPEGFILMFGRGVPFYRQAVLLSQYGFKFKEEIIWNKNKTSFPFLPLSRKHETIFIFTKKNGKIRSRKYPYMEHIENMATIEERLNKIEDTVKRLMTGLNNKDIFKSLLDFLETNKKEFVVKHVNNINKNKVYGVVPIEHYKCRKEISVLQELIYGRKEGSFIECPDVISETNLKVYYHPTEKPVRLMERLIQLVTDPSNVVLDPFMGSGSTGVASLNIDRKFIGIELDSKYFESAKKRINEKERELKSELKF